MGNRSENAREEVPPPAAAAALHILFIEPCETASARILESLRAARTPFPVSRVAPLPEAKRLCVGQTFDLILINTPIEDPQDLETLRGFAAQVHGTPLLLLPHPASPPLVHTAV